MRLETMTDIELLCTARDYLDEDAGREAFDEFVRRHRQFACNLARQYLRDSFRAQDLAQDGFVRLYRALDHYEPTGSPRGLLANIVRNACLNVLKREGRVILADDGGADLNLVGNLPAQDANPAESLEHYQERQRLVAMVDSVLPPLQRELIRLRYFHELSYDEIGQTLGITVNYVGVALHKALRALRQEMNRDF